MEYFFWFSLFFVIYTYAGYPFLLFWGVKLFPKKVDKKYLSPPPKVSIIIAARNEEKNIRRRLENILQQDYPEDNMEIIIVSDGSTDSTDEIVLDFLKKSYSIKLIKNSENMGKPHSINRALREAKGEIIVFTDARQQFERNAIKELTANFNAPAIGCVSGELFFYKNSNSGIRAEMSFYWNFEKWIRKMENDIGSVAGATGAIYAIKKSLFKPLPDETLLDDVFIPMNIVFQGYRTVFDSKAVAFDTISADMNEEKRRKVRTLLGNYQLMKILPGVLSPIKNPIFFQFLSHKIFRLFIPFFFIAIIITSYMSSGVIYKTAFISSITFVILSLTVKFFSKIPFLNKISAMASAFVSLNYFAFVAFFYFIFPGKTKVWK